MRSVAEVNGSLSLTTTRTSLPGFVMSTTVPVAYGIDAVACRQDVPRRDCCAGADEAQLLAGGLVDVADVDAHDARERRGQHVRVDTCRRRVRRSAGNYHRSDSSLPRRAKITYVGRLRGRCHTKAQRQRNQALSHARPPFLALRDRSCKKQLSKLGANCGAGR